MSRPDELFTCERDASEFLVRQLEPFFTLVPEVQMRHIDGTRLRMDFVAIPKIEFGSRLVGIEIKCRYNAFREFARALKQCIDYRHSTFTDKRAIHSMGTTPEFVFLFPPMGRGGSYETWTAGAIRLAGQFNVGTIHTLTRQWARVGWPGDIPKPSRLGEIVEMRVSDTRLWSSESGATAVRGFGSARHRGSA